MSGGIGFSRQGSDSFKQNRALRNKRKTVGENPFSSNKSKLSKNRGSFNLKEIQNYRAKHRKKAKLKSRTVILFLILVSMMITIYLIK